ncbi:hypothetical protein SPRG_03409 [Saprolegnia parasitica CBS 223.65]|uniref:MIR domain-containing protein n=1 Tax=Saprolegnia parasitica (strain CBS 223.65) TaxID=695850 RepID=A0A067CZJ8_SAPPC|nr:hypothetical protein SPRG_03409 [Saprolegnia parasitica CBS 223.65]KDO32192.1 hypothetical protein SPRG_03409 [Saprolegnia parasitica CBS 223.65]|eukprot:XP_012197372.1 hypothetical protein SPRG_03409 [Saprolegnia parasitica CBS 223.65]
MQRFTSKRRNLNVDATLAAGTLGESPLSSPLRKELHRPSAHTPLSPNGLLSPRNLPASLDRVPSEYASKTTSIHAGGHGFLVYGTIVSCLSMDRGGFLAGDGLITSEVRLEGLVQSLKATVDLIDAQLTDPGSQRDVHVVACHAKDCLFEVLPKMVYEATAAFEEAKASENASTTSTGFSDAFSDLKFKSESELRLNANVYDKLHGTRVKYGQTVQLRHIKTGKYIAMQPTRDKETLEVVLSDGAAACHLTLLPRFKLRKTGEPVQLMDQIVLAATYKAQRFAMHVSTRSAVDGASTLVHASLSHASQWRLAPYDHSEKDVSSATMYQPDTGRGLRSGLCIRLLHLETSAWLGCGGGAVHLQAESGGASDAADTNSHLLSPETLWEVEKSCFLDGGLLHWTDSVCLRHVLTGQYLHVENTEAGLRVATNAQPQSSYLLRPTTLVNPRNPIGHKSAVLLQHAQTLTYLHTRSSAHLHVSSPLVTLLTPQDEDAFKIVSVSSTELHDTSRLLAYRTLCESFIASFASASGGDPRLDDVERVLSQLNTFTFLDTQTPDHVLWLRQTLLHRHQFVPLLTRMLEAPFAAYGGPFSIDYVCGFQPQNEPSDGIDELPHTNDFMSPGGGRFSNGVAPPPPPPMDKSLPIVFQWPHTAMRQLHHVLCAINILLFRMFYSSKTSDTSACRHAMPVLLALLGHGFKASVPLSYLIQEKFHLSESFASFSAIVRNFFDLIRRHGRAMRYLQFLVVLCSANGHAVPKVQEKICELLFNPSHGYSDAVLVHTRPTPTGLELCVDAVADKWVPLRTFFDDYYSHKSHATLAPYFYGLLQLYCALCMDRNYTCIRCLAGSFPRASLLACVQDPALSRSIRAVLLNLLVALHLDCEPQTPLPSPNYTRIWKEVLLHQDKLPVARDGMYSTDDWTFFGQLQTLAMTYFRKQNGLVIITEAAQNDLTLAFVRLCKKMVAFGLFRSIAELGALVLELVKLLDSRTDYWYKPSTRSHRELLDATEVVVSPTFFHRSSESTRFDLQAQNAIIQQTEGGHAMRRASLEPARLATKKTLEYTACVMPLTSRLM